MKKYAKTLEEVKEEIIKILNENSCCISCEYNEDDEDEAIPYLIRRDIQCHNRLSIDVDELM